MDGRRFLTRSTAAVLGTALTGSLLLVPAAVAQDATIEMWSWNNEGAYPVVHEDAEARFEADHPGVDIERRYIPFGDYVQLFKTAAAGDAPPCIAQIPWSGEFRDFVNSGELVPLTDAIGEGFPAFFDPIMDIVSIDGQVWAVPLDVNTLQIAYNKTLFDELGLAVPTTQSELQNIADTVTAHGRSSPGNRRSGAPRPAHTRFDLGRRKGNSDAGALDRSRRGMARLGDDAANAQFEAYLEGTSSEAEDALVVLTAAAEGIPLATADKRRGRQRRHVPEAIVLAPQELRDMVNDRLVKEGRLAADQLEAVRAIQCGELGVGD